VLHRRAEQKDGSGSALPQHRSKQVRTNLESEVGKATQPEGGVMQVEHTNSLMAGRARRTPIGVDILAALMVLAGILFVIAGISFFISGSKDVGATQARGFSAAWVGVDAAAGVIFLIFGALHEVVAIGLMRLREAARILSILLFGVSGIGACLGLTATLARLSYTALAWNIAVAVADAVALWYLLRPKVKEAFRARVPHETRRWRSVMLLRRTQWPVATRTRKGTDHV